MRKISPSSTHPLIRLLNDPARREEFGGELVDICEGIIELEKGKRDGQLPLGLLQGANTKLAEVDLTRAAPDTLVAVEKQLTAIETHVERLRGFLERRDAHLSVVP